MAPGIVQARTLTLIAPMLVVGCASDILVPRFEPVEIIDDEVCSAKVHRLSAIEQNTDGTRPQVLFGVDNSRSMYGYPTLDPPVPEYFSAARRAILDLMATTSEVDYGVTLIPDNDARTECFQAAYDVPVNRESPGAIRDRLTGTRPGTFSSTGLFFSNLREQVEAAGLGNSPTRAVVILTDGQNICPVVPEHVPYNDIETLRLKHGIVTYVLGYRGNDPTYHRRLNCFAVAGGRPRDPACASLDENTCATDELTCYYPADSAGSTYSVYRSLREMVVPLSTCRFTTTASPKQDLVLWMEDSSGVISIPSAVKDGEGWSWEGNVVRLSQGWCEMAQNSDARLTFHNVCAP